MFLSELMKIIYFLVKTSKNNFPNNLFLYITGWNESCYLD